MTMAVLKLKSSDGTYLNYTLDKTITTLGRSKTNDIVVDDTSISRLHVRIENRNGQYFVIDNNSSNGTYLNRRKVATAPLHDGDTLIAGQVQFHFSHKLVGGMKTQALPLMGIDENLPGLGQTITASFKDTPPGAQNKVQPPPPHLAPPQNPPMAPPAVASNPSSPPPVATEPPQPPHPPVPAPMSQAPPPPGPSMPPPQPVHGSTAPQPGLPYQTMLDPELFDVASPFSRLIAQILDALLISLLVIPSFALTFMGQEMIGMVLSILPLVAGLVNFFGGWLKYGKTIGKHLMGIRIVSIESPHQQGLSFNILIKRVVGMLICGLTMNLLYLTVLFDDEGRGFHDKFAQTKVVKY